MHAYAARALACISVPEQRDTNKQPNGHICMPELRHTPVFSRRGINLSWTGIQPNAPVDATDPTMDGHPVKCPVWFNLYYETARMPEFITCFPERAMASTMACSFWYIVWNSERHFCRLTVPCAVSAQYSRKEEYQSLWTIVPSDRTYILWDSFFLI